MKQGNDEKAFKLIDTFAKEILVLNCGKKIPTVWMTRLKRQLASTLPAKVGRKRNYDEVREIVMQLTLSREEFEAERTKHNSQAKVINRISEDLSVSSKKDVNSKKVERMLDDIKSVLKSSDSLDAETRQACFEGISDAIWEELEEERKKELKGNSARLRKIMARQNDGKTK